MLLFIQPFFKFKDILEEATWYLHLFLSVKLHMHLLEVGFALTNDISIFQLCNGKTGYFITFLSFDTFLFKSFIGFTGTLLIIEYCCGFCLSMFLGALFHWKVVCYITTIFPTIGLCIMFCLRETPSWLLR